MHSVTREIDRVDWDFNPVVIYRLYKKSLSATLQGVQSFAPDTIPCYIIEIKTKDETLNLAINRQTFFLEYMRPGNAIDANNYSKYYNHRVIEGLVFETASHAIMNGNIYFADQWLNIRINEPIDPGVFVLPDQP